MALNPPLLKLYNSAQLALDDIHKFTKEQDYGVSTFRSKTDKQVPLTVRKLWLKCAKGRDYTKGSKMRHTGSHMTGCPFELSLTHIGIGWQLEVQNPDHNYKAFTHPRALPHYCQRTQETNQTIADIMTSSIAPSKILTNLLKKDITITLNDIYPLARQRPTRRRPVHEHQNQIYACIYIEFNH